MPQTILRLETRAFKMIYYRVDEGFLLISGCKKVMRLNTFRTD
jgi:hypothetical protein